MRIPQISKPSFSTAFFRKKLKLSWALVVWVKAELCFSWKSSAAVAYPRVRSLKMTHTFSGLNWLYLVCTLSRESMRL